MRQFPAHFRFIYFPLFLTPVISLLFLFTLQSEVYASWYIDKYGYLVQDDSHVLGIVYAKDDNEGDDGGGSNSGSGGGSSGSGSSGAGVGNSGSSSSDGGSERSGGSSGSSGSGKSGGESRSDSSGTSSGSSGSVTSTTPVDCIGPDGKHMQLSFKACADFNQAWNNPGFSFTPLKTSTSKSKPSNATGQISSFVPTEVVIPTSKAEPTEFEQEQQEEIDQLEAEVEVENSPETIGSPKIKIEENKTEIKFGEDEKIKTRTKNGETRTDVYSGGVKVRFEQKDGRLIIKAENEIGEDVELGEQEIFKIEERVDKNSIKIATGSGNSFVVARGNVAATTSVPLSVDLATNTLSVQTPDGVKKIAVLPDAAVQNMLAANVIDRLGSQGLNQTIETDSITGVQDVVEMGLKNNIPVYEIHGISDQKLLGFIPTEIARTVIVSAETGEVITIEKSSLMTILDLLSV